jgi:predicted DNA-binding transcriptional regulator AlpA
MYPAEGLPLGGTAEWTAARTAVARSTVRGDGSAEVLLTVQDVARILRVPVSWVYDHVRPGCRQRLPVFKLGKYLRFRAVGIAEYVQTMAAPRRTR